LALVLAWACRSCTGLRAKLASLQSKWGIGSFRSDSAVACRSHLFQQQLLQAPKTDLARIAQDEFKAVEAWLTLFQAPRRPYEVHLAGSAVKLSCMDGLLWTGDPPPPDITKWPLAVELRKAIEDDIGGIRGAMPRRIAYIVPAQLQSGKALLTASRTECPIPTARSR